MNSNSDPFDRGLSNFRGTKDYFGAIARKRQVVLRTIRETYELFGFEPLETPAIENERTLAGKYGEEGEMKRFRLSLPFPQEAGLRYDQTVPLARFVALNWNSFPMPYRRYAIGPVWRNESPAAGRLREFTQCDFDTVGSNSQIIDAEVIAINYTVLSRLNFGDQYTIIINDRRLLDAISTTIGIKEEYRTALYRAWDKIEKADWPSILDDLKNDGLGADTIKRIDQITSSLKQIATEDNDSILNMIKSRLPSESISIAVASFQNLLTMIRSFKVPEDRFKIYPLLARGLDYYTGPIFETIVTNGVGSISGGGRFDKLIETLGGPNLPASGSSFGLERVIDVMDQLEIPYPSFDSPDVFVTVFDNTDIRSIQASLEIASILRLDNIKVEVYTGDNKKLSKQFDIARRKGFKFVIVIGPEEIGNATVSIKNLQTGTQEIIEKNAITNFLF